MSKIVINGLNSKSGGGKSILNNYLSILVNKAESKNHYIVLVDDYQTYEKYESDKIKITTIGELYSKTIFAPFVYLFLLNRFLKKEKVDLIFNLGDLIVYTDVKQIYLFDWAYAIYPDTVVWDRMLFREKLIRKSKVFLLSKTINKPTVVVAQTAVSKDRLNKLYDITNVKVVPNAVSLENLNSDISYDFKMPKGIKLLYLTYYYSHKNLEIFLPLAKEIMKRDLDYKLIITVDKNQDPRAGMLLDEIKRCNLDEIIFNIGPVDMKYVPALYKSCQGMLMPTLLESFSGTYVEALFHRTPIFTSDFDFARSVCKENAYYFNPLSHLSILEILEDAFSNEPLMNKKVNNGFELLNSYPSWDTAYSMFESIINECLSGDEIA